MIIQSIHNSLDMVYNQYRNTVYKTLVDPITHRQYIEVVQFLYTKNGAIEAPVKGSNIDTQA